MRLAMDSLVSLPRLQKALGVDPKTIEWMMARSRTKAYGRDWEAFEVVDTQPMVDWFGALQGTDGYFVTENSRVFDGYGCARPDRNSDCAGTASRQWSSSGSGYAIGTDFLESVSRGVATFITVSTYDGAIWTPSIEMAIGAALQQSGSNTLKDLLSSIDYDPNGANFLSSRPGLLTVSYRSPVVTKKVMMPTSYNSGHSVSLRAPDQLLPDVMTFYSKWSH
jgi:hypothetical protein